MATKHVFCRDKSMLAATNNLLRQTFVVTNNFVTTKLLSRQAYFCRDKRHVLSRQKYSCRDRTFVVTNMCSSRQKYFVATNIILSWQKFCRSKHTFVMTKDVFCRDKHGGGVSRCSHHWATSSTVGEALPPILLCAITTTTHQRRLSNFRSLHFFSTTLSINKSQQLIAGLGRSPTIFMPVDEILLLFAYLTIWHVGDNLTRFRRLKCGHLRIILTGLERFSSTFQIVNFIFTPRRYRGC